MAKQRDIVPDIMRGIGIVLMVAGHSGFAGSDFIYLFHMALFFMLSGWFFSPTAAATPAGLRRFCLRRIQTLWFPFVAANTAFTVLNNLFLRLHILTDDPRITEIGGTVTQSTTLKDILGRTLHWCVFDGGTQLGGALWFVQALFQISILYALAEFFLQNVLHCRDTLIPQGLISGVLLWVGSYCQTIGWNTYGLGIVCSCYALFYFGYVLRRTEHRQRAPGIRAVLIAAAFVVLLVLRRFGSVGLAGNNYPGPIFLLCASLAGWILVYEIANLLASLSPAATVLSYLGRSTMPVVILHFLSFKLVTFAGLACTGGELYLLAAFPTYFSGGAWWVAYTAVGLVLPLLANAAWQRCKALILRK